MAVVAFGNSAAADERLACVRASDDAQKQRSLGQLISARKSLLTCAREVCPGPVRRFCDNLLESVETSTPTVLPHLTDKDGHDVTDVRMFVDDVLLASQLDGRAISVDPGAHVFRFEVAAAPPIVDRVLIIEAQKNRVLNESVAPPEPVAQTSATPAPPPPKESRSSPSGSDDRVHRRHALPAGTWALGAVGVVGLGAFAAFSIAGSSSYSDCVSSPCSSSTKSSLTTLRVLAWTSLGVGVLGAAGAAVIYFGSSSSSKKTAAMSLSLMPSGGGLTFMKPF